MGRATLAGRAWHPGHTEVAGSGVVPTPYPEITLTLDDIHAGVEVAG